MDSLEELKQKLKSYKKEDIELLGAINYVPPMEHEHTWEIGKNYVIKCWLNDQVPVIRVLSHNVIIFHGIIKNKSELKKLLIQLQIINE